MNRQVMVFGSYVTDLCVRTKAFPKRGETVRGNTFLLGPGGKGSNQAIAAKRAGADISFVTKLGDDEFGRQALKFYEAEQMDTSKILIDEEMQTGVALIIVDEISSQNQIIVVSGASGNFTDADLPSLLASLETSDWLLLQLETNLEPVYVLLKNAELHGVRVVLNPAPAHVLSEECLCCVDVITPNENEAESLTGIRVTDETSARLAAQHLHRSGVEMVVITMGEKGCYASDGEQGAMIHAVDCGKVVDTTGAGDALSGSLVAALSRGMSFFDSVVYSNCAAGLSVTRYGTAPGMPFRKEIDQLYQRIRQG